MASFAQKQHIALSFLNFRRRVAATVCPSPDAHVYMTITNIRSVLSAEAIAWKHEWCFLIHLTFSNDDVHNVHLQFWLRAYSIFMSECSIPSILNISHDTAA